VNRRHRCGHIRQRRISDDRDIAMADYPLGLKRKTYDLRAPGIVRETLPAGM